MTINRPRFHSNPEQLLQDGEIIPFLQERGWLVEKMHGNAFQKGIPDLYCYHPGLDLHKWIDVKLPQGSTLTKAQCQKWPVWEQWGIDIYIMKAATEEEYQKIFGKGNWREMWKPRYDAYIREVNDILDEMEDENE